MRVYIIDDIFFHDVTDYTGEEMIVYPVKISLLDLLKLKKEGISYTRNPDKAGTWILNIRSKTNRDFGGIMIKHFIKAIRFNARDYNWDKIRQCKQDGEIVKPNPNRSRDFMTNLKVQTNSEGASSEIQERTNNLEKDNNDLEK